MRTLISEQELRVGVAELAQRVSEEFDGKPLVIVGVLQDSIVLLADLMRLMYIPSQMGIIQTRSEHVGPDKPMALCIDGQVAHMVRDNHVLVVGDVLSSGYSLLEVLCQLDNLSILSLRSAVLLRKSGCQQVPIEPDYVVFDIENEIVCGYGLDYQGTYRHLPYIAALDSRDLEVREAVSPSLGQAAAADQGGQRRS